METITQISDAKLASVNTSPNVTRHVPSGLGDNILSSSNPHAITISCQIRFSLLCLHPGRPSSMICETALGIIF